MVKKDKQIRAGVSPPPFQAMPERKHFFTEGFPLCHAISHIWGAYLHLPGAIKITYILKYLVVLLLMEAGTFLVGQFFMAILKPCKRFLIHIPPSSVPGCVH